MTRPEHKTGTRDEWLAARVELLKTEKELTHRGDEVRQQRLELPWVRIDKTYRFDTDDGPATLADLFKGRSQLLIYHFMFGPDYTAGCPACSSIADGFNGAVTHLANHDVILENGSVYHTYSAFARGLDAMWSMYQWLDRTPMGRNEPRMWIRRHDEYDRS